MTPQRVRQLVAFLRRLGVDPTLPGGPGDDAAALAPIEEALSHSSAGLARNHEQLEFLGDAVLRLAAADRLNVPQEGREGGWPRRRGPAATTADPESLHSLIKMQSLIAWEPMATMTIRNIDDHLKARLRVRAAQHGRSMEDEARDILRAALSSRSSGPASLVDSVRARIEPLGGVELQLPPREPLRTPPEFDA